MQGLISIGISEDEAEDLWVAQCNKKRAFGKFLKDIESQRAKSDILQKFPYRKGKVPGPVGMIHDLTITGLVEGMGKAEKLALAKKTDIDSESASWAWLIAAGKSSGQEWQFSSNARDKGGAWSPAAMEVWGAGKALVAGDEVDWTKKKAIVTGKGRRKYEWKSPGTAHEWDQVGKKEPVEWLSATQGQLSKSRKVIKETRLVWGTRWDNPLQMALDMDPPPQVIYFMTDGVAKGSDRWAREIGARAKSRGVKINCVAMMQPKAHDAMEDLAKRTDGHFTIVMQGGQRKKVR